MLRKYTAPANVYSPFYSWDAHMALDLTVYRRGRGAVMFRSVFQSVGTENFGSRVSVGGTGYVIGVGYLHRYSSTFTLSAGIGHLSSHLTRDLDEKLEDEAALGSSIPTVTDPAEYNALFVKAHRIFANHRFSPELEVVVQPVSIDLRGGRLGDVRPVYVRTRWTLWTGHEKAIVAETQHEFGTNPFTHVSLVCELHARDEANGRFHLFVSGSPGGNVHVSPNIAGLRDGVSFGVRMRFRG
jgi:hypothetical protein